MSEIVKGQIGMDERVVIDDELEKSLEEREGRRTSLGRSRKLYEASDEKAKGLLQRLTFEPDEAIRIGRFRITKTETKGRDVSFQTKASSRIRITTKDEA